MNQLDERPAIEITVAWSYLGQEDYEAVEAELQPHFRVSGGVAYELSEVEVAHVVVQFLVNAGQTVAWGALGNYIFDAFKKRFLKPKEADKTFFEFMVKDVNGVKSTYASLETSDEEILKKALTTLEDLAKPESKDEIFDFDKDNKRWKRRRS